MADTTTENILDALLAITYSATAHTKERIFQLHDLQFKDFTNYPLIVVESGDEQIEGLANRMATSIFTPAVHFIIEAAAADTIETWRESIRNAIMGSATLWAYVHELLITEIAVEESEDKKLEHMTFKLSAKFDRAYTVA